jgi:branched-chain amino acid transport system ATP-binding protein
MSALLQVEGVSKIFDGLVAVSNATFDVREGAITALIGPNGAGKSTMLNMISGALPVSMGKITFDNRKITNKPPHKIAGYGVARTFQNVELFSNMSALENVMIGRHLRGRCGMLAASTRLWHLRREELKIEADARVFLNRVGLGDEADEPAGDLPFGKQRLLEIARAIAVEPKLLLLDEAASGLSTREKKELVKLIYSLRSDGITIFMVDHDMDLVMDISEHVIVLDHGEKIAEGTPQQVQKNEKVIAAYLGEEVADA